MELMHTVGIAFLQIVLQAMLTFWIGFVGLFLLQREYAKECEAKDDRASRKGFWRWIQRNMEIG